MGNLNPMSAMLNLGGTILRAKGERKAAQAQARALQQEAAAKRVSAEYGALQHETLAGQARAAAQRAAYEQRKAAALLASKAQAAAAASGAGASDPTVVDIIDRISGEGAYRAALALYEGEASAREHLMSAEALRVSGESLVQSRAAEAGALSKASNLSTWSTLLRGASSFIDRFDTPGVP